MQSLQSGGNFEVASTALRGARGFEPPAKVGAFGSRNRVDEQVARERSFRFADGRRQAPQALSSVAREIEIDPF
jgi:hypothetical protein